MYAPYAQHLTALLPALQVVLSFHACGGNVNDVAQIPLPAWVLKVCSPQDTFWLAEPAPRSSRGLCGSTI
jgi:hypothetical protein